MDHLVLYRIEGNTLTVYSVAPATSQHAGFYTELSIDVVT